MTPIPPGQIEKSISHLPVLPDEALHGLRADRGGCFFDGTVGLAGHSEAILRASPGNYLYGTDRDNQALALARQRLSPYNGHFTLFHRDFRQLTGLPLDIGIIDGFLFDLGVSSFQLEDRQKGFSYSQDAPLDMRMDQTQGQTAAEVVNTYSYEQLAGILREYGELRNPGKLIDQVVFHRKGKKIVTTGELKEIVRRVMPKTKTMDPLARVFQALRIEVNQELTGLPDFFQELFGRMKPGARVVIISFHSLEDRIAKTVFKQGQKKGMMTILTGKPITASAAELRANPRSRSAKLRAAERL